MSENYFQHADHFTRILKDQEDLKKIKFSQKNEISKNENSLDHEKTGTVENEVSKINQA